MERLIIINPLETTRKTAKLLREFPQFQRQVQPAIMSIAEQNASILHVILDHYGTKYDEMGFCTKIFADMIRPESENTDIGICATEFYVFIDILDSAIDGPLCSFDQKVEILKKSQDILRGNKEEKTEDIDLQAMNAVMQDLRQRVICLSNSPAGIEHFIKRSLGTIDALYREAKPHFQKRSLVRLAEVGRKCTYPLMELINCKFGESIPYITAGNLVAIGNILDDYWDIVKDKKAGKKTFLTMSLPDKPMNNPEIIFRSMINMGTHRLAAQYAFKLFSRAMEPIDKDWQEDALAIALFAQFGVFKRRFNSIKTSFSSLLEKK